MKKKNDEQREQRVFLVHELRAEGDESPVITGYIARFNSPSEDLGGFIEIIRPGAFTKTIAENDIRALWQHKPEMVLGRTKNGTLRLFEDDFGLRFEANPPDTSWARDAITSIRRGDVDQASFGFETIRDDKNWDTTPMTRTLIEVKLYDVSPVTFPAYPATSVALRQLIEEHSGAPLQEEHPPVEDGVADEQARARVALKRKRLDVLEKTFTEAYP